jgi:hypothetical protein
MIKKILDDAADNIELYPELTVADVWVDFGKARSDGLDQRGSVRVIQKLAAAAPERFPSVDHDWDAVITAYERSRDAEKKAAANRVSPIVEEDENEVSCGGSWSHLLDLSQSKQQEKNLTPFPHDFTSERHQGVVSSVEADDQDLSHPPTNRPTIAGTPSQRAESEELGEWPSPAQPERSSLAKPSSQPAPVTANQPKSKRKSQDATQGKISVATRRISQIPDDVKSVQEEPLATVSQSRSRPSQRQPGVFDLGDSTEDSDSSSDGSPHKDDHDQLKKENTVNNDVSKDRQSSGSDSTSEGNSQNEIEDHLNEAQVHKSIASENDDVEADGDVFIGLDHSVAKTQPSAVSRKRKQSVEWPSAVKEPRLERAHPSRRELSMSNFSSGTSPHDTPRQIKSQIPLSKAQPVAPKPNSSSSPHMPRNGDQTQQMVAAHEQERREKGMGLGITRSGASNLPLRKLPHELATEFSSPSAENSRPTIVSSRKRLLAPAPSSATSKAKAPEKTPNSSAFDINRGTPSASSIRHLYPKDSPDGTPTSTKEAHQGTRDKPKSRIKDADEARLREQEKEELASLELLLQRPNIDTETESVVTDMVKILKRMTKVEVAKREIQRLKLLPLRMSLQRLEQKPKTEIPRSSPIRPPVGMPPHRTLKELMQDQQADLAARAAAPPSPPAPEPVAAYSGVVKIFDDSDDDSDSDSSVSDSGDIMPDGQMTKLQKPWPLKS